MKITLHKDASKFKFLLKDVGFKLMKLTKLMMKVVMLMMKLLMRMMLKIMRLIIMIMRMMMMMMMKYLLKDVGFKKSRSMLVSRWGGDSPSPQ